MQPLKRRDERYNLYISAYNVIIRSYIKKKKKYKKNINSSFINSYHKKGKTPKNDICKRRAITRLGINLNDS